MTDVVRHVATTDKLIVDGLVAGYGGIVALRGVSLEVDPGEIVTVVGRNGAGKSTLLNTVCGLVQARSGTVTLGGRSLTRQPAHKITRAGLALVPEGRCVVAPLTVAENLNLSKSARRSNAKEMTEWVFELFPRLWERREQHAGSLSGGEQQMLAVGRALVTNPTFLLLDEPSMGLAPTIVDKVFESLIEINNNGIPMLLVEQDAVLAAAIADRMYVLHQGTVIATGDPATLLADEEITAAYLG